MEARARGFESRAKHIFDAGQNGSKGFFPFGFFGSATFSEKNFQMVRGYSLNFMNKVLRIESFFWHYETSSEKIISKITIFFKIGVFRCFELGKSDLRVLWVFLRVFFGAVHLMKFPQLCFFAYLKNFALFSRRFSLEKSRL